MPLPDAVQAGHSAAVAARVHAELAAAGGWMSFERYLQIVLYAPGLGYYSAGATKFGAAGDFITAPDLSPLFGRCIARQCAQVLETLGGGELLELGAGSGSLAVELLAALERLGRLPRRYCIVEISADLRARQAERLAALPAHLQTLVEWLDSPPDARFRGVMFANEVADALPFRCFAIAAGADGCSSAMLERGVGRMDSGALGWAERPADLTLAAELGRLAAQLQRPWSAGQRGEVCLLQDSWLRQLAMALDAGLLLLVDYGGSRRELFHPAQRTGTLRCYYRQRVHDDPFVLPGLQDITASVDFTRLAESASRAGLEVSGFCTQAAFLLGCGIEAELASIADDSQRARLAGGARQLLLPEEMGERFKVMALTRRLDCALRGFGIQDLRRQL